MEKNFGRIIGVNGNLVTVEFDKPVIQNETAFAITGDLRLKGEVIRIRGRFADMQVFEDTVGLRVGDQVEFSGELLSVELGPGLLGQVFDGLQNPLHKLADQGGHFLKRGLYLPPVDRERTWNYSPLAKKKAVLKAGEVLGFVTEGMFKHMIMVPFGMQGKVTVVETSPEGSYTVEETVAKVEDERGEVVDIKMLQTWPVKIPIKCYAERMRPIEPMVTKVRVIDSFCPVALGGTFCVPGPFGAGKTVLQQIISRHAEVDVVIVAACGERAGEVVETIREFPELKDPRTGRSLMERTLIICNTSSMPVAAREASVYTAVTLAEYYRQMGLNVLLLADSTSRWAQALREMSGRLEEIPGEEAFPAYLESVIAAFYERAGLVRLSDGSEASVTIGGTVSPAGGNFEEPVTQATLKVVGAFHGLSRERSDARRYPAIDALDSWSRYPSVVDTKRLSAVKSLMHKGAEVGRMMKVTGEEGASMEDFILFLKSEFMDDVYLQQDAYDDVDGACSYDRQRYVFDKLAKILSGSMDFEEKDAARKFFQRMTQAVKDWNRAPMGSEEFKTMEKKVMSMPAELADYA